jgi:hypothetical protein
MAAMVNGKDSVKKFGSGSEIFSTGVHTFRNYGLKATPSDGPLQIPLSGRKYRLGWHRLRVNFYMMDFRFMLPTVCQFQVSWLMAGIIIRI